jgi:hypothetical protein
MFLIHPPVAKACEPPAGIAYLAGALKAHHISATVFDANIEGLLHLLDRPPAFIDAEEDTWTKRAFRNRSLHLTTIKNPSGYSSLPQYKRAVRDIDRILAKIGGVSQVRMGLANYQHERLSPTRSEDLIRAAEEAEKNPFHLFYRRRLGEYLEKAGPKQIGFSLNFLSQALSTFAMVGFVKDHFPDLPIVLGGGLVTSWVKGLGRRNPFSGLVEKLIAGPGEIPILSSWGISGNTEESFLPDFDPLPLARYLSPGFVLPYSTTRGCYWNRCLFCPEKAEKNPYIALPAAQAVSDLSFLTEKYKPSLVHLLDNALPPPVLEKIAKKPFGAPWYGFARITPHFADLDFCLALKGSGCLMLQLGVESGDQGVLDRLQKGIDLKIVSQSLKNLRAAGIAVYLYLLFGTPQETSVEARRTLEFTVRHCEEISFLNLAIFNLPRLGDGISHLQTAEFSEGDLSLYTGFTHPRGWNRKDVRQFLDKEFKRQPAIAAILRRDPPIFTSNHAPFFGGFFSPQRAQSPQR